MNLSINRRPQHGGRHSRPGQPNRGPNNKSNWQRLREHYLQRARAALDDGNRIEAENFYQHADHYFRMIEGTAA